ncbi:MAG TPA: hypothetical protein VK796_01255 [Cytophaga sp.]|nr:hypothetical protein [Cytophaga sp.]
MKKSSDKRIWEFEGVVSGNTFSLSPIFYSGHEKRFRPELHGIIMPEIIGSKLLLKLRLPLSYKIILYTGFILNSFIWLYILFERRNVELTFIDLRVGYPIAGLITLIMLLVDFYQNGNRGVRILIAKLKLNPE